MLPFILYPSQFILTPDSLDMNYSDCLRYLDSLGQEVHGLQ